MNDHIYLLSKYDFLQPRGQEELIRDELSKYGQFTVVYTLFTAGRAY